MRMWDQSDNFYKPDPTCSPGICSKINLPVDSGESGGGKVYERRRRGGRRVETTRSVGVEGMGDLLVDLAGGGVENWVTESKVG
ncbi:hypothetical protein RHMOL_Rhmol08G0184300 [Rhododendron molle]|uniref:Uncharacterized protein n=1 Tax=Rhododendron molle TaxID=49168 RepID=A0ACC0MPM3_RHOML|nr:hypothetical protein RHMOL_Rhmol08G0184300 [Rhododendron molle]